GSLSPDPEQAGDADVDLIDQGQVLVAFGVLDFIDANRVDLTEGAVLQSPGDDMFDRIEHLVPGRAKALCGFFPRKAACPTRQEKHVRLGQGALAVAPGNFFDGYNATAATLDAPHGVQKEDEESPERDEFKAPFGKLIVARRRLVATRAD